MVALNEKSKLIQIVISSIPILLSYTFLIWQSWVILIICIVSLFLIIGIVPLFKRRESLYMFILVALSGFPINIELSYWIISEEYIDSGFLIGNIVWAMLLCCTFFSIEEIVFGVITRMIWKRQYKLKI